METIFYILYWLIVIAAIVLIASCVIGFINKEGK